jgi:hypothetical protein
LHGAIDIVSLREIGRHFRSPFPVNRSPKNGQAKKNKKKQYGNVE